MLKITNIVWDFDEGEEGSFTELPDNVIIEDSIEEEEIADYLSDNYGWCVESFDVEVIE